MPMLSRRVNAKRSSGATSWPRREALEMQSACHLRAQRNFRSNVAPKVRGAAGEAPSEKADEFTEAK